LTAKLCAVSKPTLFNRASCSPAWNEALTEFAADLRRRAVSANTVQAYMNDCQQLADWATGRQLEPQAVDMRTLRRYVAGLSEQGQAPSTVARKLAAVRAMFRVQMQLGLIGQNPADLVTAPKRPRTLPRVLKHDEIELLLDRIPAVTPLELRDRALLELAYSSGLRAEELVTVEVGAIDFDSETVRVEGKGDKTRIVPVGEHALAAISRYLDKARPALRIEKGDDGTAMQPCRSPCSSQRPVGSSALLMYGAGCGRGHAPAKVGHPLWGRPILTPSGTHLRPICWRAAQISVRFRNS
jgi:site-specific recombinase XerD